MFYHIVCTCARIVYVPLLIYFNYTSSGTADMTDGIIGILLVRRSMNSYYMLHEYAKGLIAPRRLVGVASSLL